MKNLYFLALICALIFTSCQKDYSIVDPTQSGGGGNGGGGSTSNAACKTCLYFPTCNNTVYTFKDSTSTGVTTSTDTIKYVKDSTIGGVSFRQYYSSSNPQRIFNACVNGNVRTIAYNGTTQGGSTIQAIDITILKYNEAVGAQWTDVLTFNGSTAEYRNTLVAKNISRTVGNLTFTDVMHVRTIAGIILPGAGFFPTQTTDYYFAKNVGYIESTTINEFTGELQLKRSIQSYIIP